MNSDELIKYAVERIEAMSDAIDGCFELLNGISAERRVVLYLLWLGQNEKN